jgi:hypothetical protein
MNNTIVSAAPVRLVAIFTLGFAGVLTGGDLRAADPQSERAHTSIVTRGERIQPLVAGTLQSSVISNAVSPPTATNLAVADVEFDVRQGILIGFDMLAGFPLTLGDDLEYATNAPLADARINAMIPESIRRLEGRAIRISGYMTPVEFEDGKTKSFILSRNPSGCCFGDMPLIHELVEVRMNGAGTPVLRYVPVQVFGVLHVGAKRRGEVLTSIYRLDARSVIEAAR